MRALRKRPGEAWEPIAVENELKPLQQEVGGYLESVTLAEDVCVLCDEEGRMKGKPYNTTVCGVSFVGTILIVGVAGEDFADLTEKQEESLRFLGILPGSAEEQG